MSNLPELFYVRTVPLSGTHFLAELIRLADPRELQVIYIHIGEMKDILLKAIRNEISYCDMMVGLLDHYRLSPDLRFFGILEHLYKPETRWIHRLAVSGLLSYQAKTVTTIRHYRDIVLTNLLYTTETTKKSDEGRKRGLRWTRSGLEYLADHIDDKNFFFVPIDLLGKQPVESRMAFTKRLLQDFLGVTKIQQELFERFVTEWKPLHAINKTLDIEAVKKTDDEFRALMDIKESGGNLQRIHEEFDWEMEFYGGQHKIQEMFKRMGYFDE